jgi:hypothetical protein
MMTRRTVIVIALGFIVVLVIAAALLIPWSDYYGPFVMRRLVRNGERHLLYDINHEALATELRRFANQMRWGRPVKHTEPESFDSSDPVVPPSLRILRSSGVTIYDDHIEYDCGSPFLDFGIVVFREGIPGTGTKKLGEGIWFYSADNRVPSE